MRLTQNLRAAPAQAPHTEENAGPRNEAENANGGSSEQLQLQLQVRETKQSYLRRRLASPKE